MDTIWHPYYPVNAGLPHYVANEAPFLQLLVAFGVTIAIVVVAVLMVARRIHPEMATSDQLLVSWFALCGFLHCFFEGYFIWNHRRLASMQTLFAQLWKEYALSDSRYLTSDPFMLCVESFTVVVWGPLCWAIIVAITWRSHARYPLQVIILAELYFNGVSHSRPEFLYFWVYYVGFNAPWVVVPAVVLFRSVVHIKNGLQDRHVKVA
ncbi:putative emopamil binding protein [Colletotrichum sublineola]|uniref:Putative emopamil binding protein n=1 Tax=Colletotrichum sublineola TaxID=1173701 RepID=A0A066XME0_COLSU|nr:putative emopamil binding protein [Colletotrichum sublineola]